MGMSIFMQGSHKLVDENGETIVILQSSNDKIKLKSFEGKKVTAQGSAEDTVEAGGRILNVDAIKSL